MITSSWRSKYPRISYFHTRIDEVGLNTLLKVANEEQRVILERLVDDAKDKHVAQRAEELLSNLQLAKDKKPAIHYSYYDLTLAPTGRSITIREVSSRELGIENDFLWKNDHGVMGAHVGVVVVNEKNGKKYAYFTVPMTKSHNLITTRHENPFRIELQQNEPVREQLQTLLEQQEKFS